MPTALEYVAFVFAIVTIPIYLFLIYILHKEVKDSKKSNAFYQICLVVGYIDIFCVLNNYCIFLPPRWNWFVEFYLRIGKPLLKVCFFISWAANLAQLQATLLMALNRFTALVYAQSHDLMWRNKTLHILGFILVPSLLLGCGTLFSGVEYRVEDDELSQKLTE